MARSEKKKILLVPLDPVHDVGLKLIRRALDEAGHATELLPPGMEPREVLNTLLEDGFEFVLVSRTLGYRVVENLARFVDLVEAAGLREKLKLILGGMAVRPELAAELGFDAGFGPGTEPAEVVDYIDGRAPTSQRIELEEQKEKPSLLEGYSYTFRHKEIERALDAIVAGIIAWTKRKTSPAVERAKLRYRIFREGGKGKQELEKKYLDYCDREVVDYYRGINPQNQFRFIKEEELASLANYRYWKSPAPKARDVINRPVIFAQYGTGCPLMDIMHIKVCEGWGADGVVHFDPSWGAAKEGILSGYLAQSEDGTVITPENLKTIKQFLEPETLWQLRAHRGLNTPETVVLAGETGGDLTKINIVYGALGAGTDPARMTVDGVAAIEWAAHYGLPFDVVTNEELCGVPAHKALAGMLIVARLGQKLGGTPILQPLFCYSPEVMIQGQMRDNYVDYNAAKVLALREIVDAPLWPGAPIGFLTHTEDRVQSAVTTALHGCLARSLGVRAISIASTDEAYAGGPIASASRVDTLRATFEGFRFFGSAKIAPTARAQVWAGELVEGIKKSLAETVRAGSFIQALYRGVLGSPEDGVYPGRLGRGTLFPEGTVKNV